MKKSTKKGFTLVELVIVIAVIAILAAVLIPTFSNVVERANISADLQQLTAAIESKYIDFVADHSGVLPTGFVKDGDSFDAFVADATGNATNVVTGKNGYAFVVTVCNGVYTIEALNEKLDKAEVVTLNVVPGSNAEATLETVVGKDKNDNDVYGTLKSGVIVKAGTNVRVKVTYASGYEAPASNAVTVTPDTLVTIAGASSPYTVGVKPQVSGTATITVADAVSAP